MPLSKVSLRPGINKEGTNYSGEGGWFDSLWVRFRSGYPEKIGGWIRNGAYTFAGVARSMWNWESLAGDDLLGIGTNQKYYVELGGQYHDITPLRTTVVIDNDPITTVINTKRIKITDTAHGATAGTFVTITNGAAADITVGGITFYTTATATGTEWEIVEVVDANSYYISSPTAASASATGGGATVTAAYQLSAQNSVFVGGTGWGISGWGGPPGWGSPATLAAGDQLGLWTQDSYGQDLVIAQRAGAIYYWAADTSTWARAVTLSSLSTAAGYAGAYVPTNVYQIKTSDLQRFTIALGANPYEVGNPTSTFDPMLVRWSDQENIYEWVPADTNQAGEQRMSHGSAIVAGLTTRQEILVWTDAALYSMQYLGPPYVWGFNVLLDNISIISPNCMASAATVVYWMGTDKFYSYSGRVETLPCTLRTYVFGDLNKAQAQQIVCGTNEGYNEVWWFYPSSTSEINDRYVVYNYLERVWYHGNLTRTAWQDSPLRQYPMGCFSVQNSFLAADITSSATSIQVLDSATLPLSGTVTIDSEDISFTGNDTGYLTGCTRGVNGTTAATHLYYSAVTYKTANQVMFHEYGNDDQSGETPVAIPSYVESSDYDIGDGHNFGLVWRMLPDLTFDGSTADNPQVTLSVMPRRNSGTNYDAAADPTVTRTATYPVEQYTGQVYTRLRGRQMKMRVDSTMLGVAWQLGTPRIDIRQSGRK